MLQLVVLCRASAESTLNLILVNIREFEYDLVAMEDEIKNLHNSKDVDPWVMGHDREELIKILILQTDDLKTKIIALEKQKADLQFLLKDVDWSTLHLFDVRLQFISNVIHGISKKVWALLEHEYDN